MVHNPNPIMMKTKFFALITPFLLFANNPLFAQSAEAGSISNTALLVTAVGIVLTVTILVLLVVIYMLLNIRNIISQKSVAEDAEDSKSIEPAESIWSRFYKKATDAVPVEKEQDVLLDHDYDGIKELDNHLPPWWLWLFYGTIAFSVVYLAIYHVFDLMPLQEEKYQLAMEQAAIEAEARNIAALNENTVVFVDNPNDLNRGMSIFNTNCAACHRTDGGGSIGPNLTDEYWIHGGSVNSIFATIKYGVTEKGMQSWESVLSPTEIRDVSSYIITLVGTNPPNPKDPQGEFYVPEEKESEEEVDEIDKPEDDSSEADSTLLANN